jgi:hypothetical protein
LFRSNKFLISGSYTLACPLDPSARLPAAAPPPLYTTGRVSLIHPVTWSLSTDKWRETKGHCHYSTSSSLHIFDARRTWETLTSFCYHVYISCWENSAGHRANTHHMISLTRRAKKSSHTSWSTFACDKCCYYSSPRLNNIWLATMKHEFRTSLDQKIYRVRRRK